MLQYAERSARPGAYVILFAASMIMFIFVWCIADDGMLMVPMPVGTARFGEIDAIVARIECRDSYSGRRCYLLISCWFGSLASALPVLFWSLSRGCRRGADKVSGTLDFGSCLSGSPPKRLSLDAAIAERDEAVS